jgi:hypothetical protein
VVSSGAAPSIPPVSALIQAGAAGRAAIAADCMMADRRDVCVIPPRSGDAEVNESRFLGPCPYAR